MSLTSRLNVGDSILFYAIRPDVEPQRIEVEVGKLGGSIRRSTVELYVDDGSGIDRLISVDRKGNEREIVEGVPIRVGDQITSSSSVNLQYDYKRTDYTSRTIRHR